MNHSSVTTHIVLKQGSVWDHKSAWAEVEKLWRLNLLAAKMFCTTYDKKYEYGRATRAEVDYRADLSNIWENRHKEAHTAYFTRCKAEGMAYHVVERGWSGDIVRDYIDYVE